jgi:hypothetical protein
MVLPEEVVVHPLVLLSVVDHYTRTCKDTKKRAVGVLLGSSFKGKCDITNSFAGYFFLRLIQFGLKALLFSPL